MSTASRRRPPACADERGLRQAVSVEPEPPCAIAQPLDRDDQLGLGRIGVANARGEAERGRR